MTIYGREPSKWRDFSRGVARDSSPKLASDAHRSQHAMFNLPHDPSAYRQSDRATGKP
jgi:hypothetical protein